MSTIWEIDPTHSEVQFKVKHLVISTVTGSFNEFSGQVEAENDKFENAKVQFEAKTGSIDTGNDQRNEHLKSDDFFSAGQYPAISFTGKSFTKTSDDTFKVLGDMTIRDQTKEIALEASLGGIMQDPYGNTKAGFELSGKINRKDFGLTWSAVTEAGGVVVSDEVKLLLNVQLVKKS